MKNVRILASLLALSLVGGTGCGVEMAENTGEGELQSVAQAVCSGPPPNGGCATTPVKTDVAKSCAHSTFDFTYVCDRSGVYGCRLFNCTSGGSWSIKDIGYSCSDTLELFCH
ncbi:hypothetical protein SAMN05443639_11682 [Stigmatella erecta]|uniref:Lipoprotein n=1 Tax=Stigmatella erecta TaxID=83460 RepID=A0A1I0KYS3_9BACT|nr:hypothetical protein SAMN05443639_11682 [Stigmatella erecta]